VQHRSRTGARACRGSIVADRPVDHAPARRSRRRARRVRADLARADRRPRSTTSPEGRGRPAERRFARPRSSEGIAVGERIEADGVSVAYLTDHGARDVSRDRRSRLDLRRRDRMERRPANPRLPTMGTRHGSDSATRAPRIWRRSPKVDARWLALFHHDPMHSDDQLEGCASAIWSAGALGRSPVARRGRRRVCRPRGALIVCAHARGRHA
jgi:hypothetical protein